MKRMAMVLAVLVCLLAGCLNKEAKDVFVTPVQSDTETTKFLYKPGTYRGSATGYNGPIEVEVTVSDSQIKSIEIVSSYEANYIPEPEVDPTAPEQTDPSQTPDEEPITEEVEVVGALDGMINEILLQQSTQVDTISGATVSCKALLEAIQRALTEATLA